MGASALSREGVMAQISHHHHYHQHHHQGQHHLASAHPIVEDQQFGTVWCPWQSCNRGTLAAFKVIIRMDVRANVSQMHILSVRISMSVRMSMEFECVVV